MAKEEAASDEQQAGGGKKKLIIIIAAVVLLLGIGGGAAFFFMGGDDTAAAEQAAQEEATKEVVQPKGDPIYVEVKPAFTVNLDPQDPVGFLQIGIQILTYYEAVGEELNTNMPLIKNNLFTLFGTQKSADLRSKEGKAKLQKQILKTVQDIIDKYGSGGEVENVYFTSFVMQ